MPEVELLAIPAVPVDTATYAQAVAAGFWGKRTDPIADSYYGPAIAGGTPPKLNAISPASGPRAGATTLTLTGSGLTGAGSVSVGQLACTAVTVVDDAHVTAVTPAGQGGRQDVTVAVPTGFAVRHAAYAYT